MEWNKMKHKLLKSVIISVAFLGTTAAPTTSCQVNAARTYRAYTGSKSITYRDRNGKMTITSVEALHMKNSDYSSAGSQIIAYGKFTNTSHKGISPEDFANDHFIFYQVKSNKWHELTLNSPIIMPPTKHIDHLSSNGEDKTRPHKTVKFAISDNNPVGLSDHQKVTIRAYKEVGVTRKLASKTLISPETQNAMDYTEVPYNKNPYTSASQRKAIREAYKSHQKALRTAKVKNEKFYQNANKYDVFWGENPSEAVIHGITWNRGGAYIKNVGNISPLVAYIDNHIQLTLYFDNTSNNTVVLDALLNKYFDVSTSASSEKINFQIRDIAKRNFSKPHKNTALTLVSTNKINVSQGTKLVFTVKNEFSTNERASQIDIIYR